MSARRAARSGSERSTARRRETVSFEYHESCLEVRPVFKFDW